MASIDDILDEMRRNPSSVRFAAVARVCEHFFGAPRQAGTSHRVYRMPWPGDPRVNIQMGKNGNAKDYQVRQVLRAVDKLRAIREQEHGG
ncbi:MAG: toxin HicA [Magnetospirillum sp.]|nr:toxin HicA [Magnetospirillum sp.]